jgi:hypothetical protein
MDVEHELHAINAKLNKVVIDVSLIKQSDEFNKKDKENLTETVRELVISVNRLNLTIGNSEGVKQGKSTVMKFVWTFFGSLGVIWCSWVSLNIVSNNIDNKTILNHSKKDPHG